MADDEIGGYEISLFIAKPPDHFICAICLDVVMQPHQCRKGHMFCKTCIFKVLKIRSACPTCRDYLSAECLSFSLIARNLVDEFCIKCERSKCKWTGPLGLYEPHLKQHGTGSMSYCIDGNYTGEWLDNKRHGVGTMIEDNNDIYTGIWENDKRQGEGKMIYNSGDVYEGTWDEDKRHGEGKMIYNSGDVYAGTWENDRRNGKGKMNFNTYGEVYEGEWENDEYCGTGIFAYRSGSIYEGEWSSNKRHGIGLMTYSDDSMASYNGGFKQHKRHGFGIMVFHNGSIYEGEWVGNRRHGHGKFVSVEGVVCEGIWQDDDIQIQVFDKNTYVKQHCQMSKKTKR